MGLGRGGGGGGMRAYYRTSSMEGYAVFCINIHGGFLVSKSDKELSSSSLESTVCTNVGINYDLSDCFIVINSVKIFSFILGGTKEGVL